MTYFRPSFFSFSISFFSFSISPFLFHLFLSFPSLPFFSISPFSPHSSLSQPSNRVGPWPRRPYLQVLPVPALDFREAIAAAELPARRCLHLRRDRQVRRRVVAGPRRVLAHHGLLMRPSQEDLGGAVSGRASQLQPRHRHLRGLCLGS